MSKSADEFQENTRSCDEAFPVGQPALEEPHDDDVASKGDGVEVELEGVSVGPTL